MRQSGWSGRWRALQDLQGLVVASGIGERPAELAEQGHVAASRMATRSSTATACGAGRWPAAPGIAHGIGGIAGVGAVALGEAFELARAACSVIGAEPTEPVMSPPRPAVSEQPPHRSAAEARRASEAKTRGGGHDELHGRSRCRPVIIR